MAKTDAETLEDLRAWRDNLIAALRSPETVSGYGGMADATGSNTINRMGGRSQLLSELREVESRIEAIENRTPFTRESRAVT